MPLHRALKKGDLQHRTAEEASPWREPAASRQSRCLCFTCIVLSLVSLAAGKTRPVLGRLGIWPQICCRQWFSHN